MTAARYSTSFALFLLYVHCPPQQPALDTGLGIRNKEDLQGKICSGQYINISPLLGLAQGLAYSEIQMVCMGL